MHTDLQLFTEWFQQTYPEDFKKYHEYINQEHLTLKNFRRENNSNFSREEQEMLSRYIQQFYELQATENETQSDEGF